MTDTYRVTNQNEWKGVIGVATRMDVVYPLLAGCLDNWQREGKKKNTIFVLVSGYSVVITIVGLNLPTTSLYRHLVFSSFFFFCTVVGNYSTLSASVTRGNRLPYYSIGLFFSPIVKQSEKHT